MDEKDLVGDTLADYFNYLVSIITNQWFLLIFFLVLMIIWVLTRFKFKRSHNE